MFKLGIKNFRGFLDNEFTFSRINILIGENSAGKSSILKFLLALKQSLQVPNSRDYNLTLAGEEVDLGNYEEVIYNHEVDRNLSFSFEVGKEYVEDVSQMNEELRKLYGKIDKPTIISFGISKDVSNPTTIRTIIKNELIGEVEIIPNMPENTSTGFSLLENQPTCDIYFTSISEKEPLYLKEMPYIKTGFLPHVDITKVIGELKNKQIVEKYHACYYLLNFQFYIFFQIFSTQYLNNPDFEAAKRFYFKRDKKIKETINNIEELIYLLGGDGFLQGEILASFTQEYVAKLQEFGIVDNLYLKKIDSVRELRVVVNGIDSNITDVGFGVSLQLPIIAQAMLAEKSIIENNKIISKKGKLLLIEQPEIHLHPSLQAKFMDSLLQIGDNNMYFIETHSEHIVRKLQVLVKEGKYGLRPEDVCIHYFRKENGHIVTTLHTIDKETGKLSPKFPKGFYDVSTNLAYELIN